MEDDSDSFHEPSYPPVALPTAANHTGNIKNSCDELERYGQWLISIPRENVAMLQATPEYNAFRLAFEGLGIAHRKAILQNRALMEREDTLCRTKGDAVGVNSSGNSNNKTNSEIMGRKQQHQQIQRQYSFLQNLAVDDVVLRVLEFLPCSSLIRTSETCHRFHQLSHKSANQRTQFMSEGRYYLDSGMKLLRAKEQIEGILPDPGPVVRIPLLGLRRRIIVTEAGDEEYNGIYFCTGSNGNGFLFTKPRIGLEGERWRGDRVQGMNIDVCNEELARRQRVEGSDWRTGNENSTVVNAEGEETDSFFAGRVLRCIIGKRFSNETILWYMSKEVENESGEISQVFSFWAKLMVTGDASSDVCRYPSQTSILSRNGDPAWQSLSSTRGTDPPIVELLD